MDVEVQVDGAEDTLVTGTRRLSVICVLLRISGLAHAASSTAYM